MSDEKRDKIGRRIGRPRKVFSLESLLERAEPEPNTGCWLWIGPVAGGTGYGVAKHDGRAIGAHRLAFVLAHGPVSAGNDVCHSCDVRVCINPRHLFQGTRRENLADMRAKGRSNNVRGAKHGKARFSEAQVLDIRAAVAAGTTMAALAREYGVTKQSIASIHHRRSWRHLKEQA